MLGTLPLRLCEVHGEDDAGLASEASSLLSTRRHSPFFVDVEKAGVKNNLNMVN